MRKNKITLQIDKKAFIVAILNFILVGLGYIYLRRFKRALVFFLIYLVSVMFLSYIATFFSPLIWIGLIINLYFAWDGYKLAIKNKRRLKVRR